MNPGRAYIAFLTCMDIEKSLVMHESLKIWSYILCNILMCCARTYFPFIFSLITTQSWIGPCFPLFNSLHFSLLFFAAFLFPKFVVSCHIYKHNKVGFSTSCWKNPTIMRPSGNWKISIRTASLLSWIPEPSVNNKLKRREGSGMIDR
jgi:hypothetical protein